MKGAAFAPASIGNVGPGFDVLGLAVDGAGDTVEIELHDGPTSVEVRGRDAAAIPTDPFRNCAAVAAGAMLRTMGRSCTFSMRILKGLPLSGGMGGSAASSVAGALAAARAACSSYTDHDVIAAALEGEALVSGRHLDNIAPALLGGLVLCRSVDPIDVVPIRVSAAWWVAMVTPAVRVETKAARTILPDLIDRSTWIQQMANTAALAQAFATGDGSLVSRSLDDRFAEPRRAGLIPHFFEVKAAARAAGAFAASISGSGPTVFAICPDETTARRCARNMALAFGEIASTEHVGEIYRRTQ